MQRHSEQCSQIDLNSGLDLQKMSGGFMCESGIFLGGYLQNCQDTRKILLNYGKLQGLKRKTGEGLLLPHAGGRGAPWPAESSAPRVAAGSASARNGERKRKGSRRATHRRWGRRETAGIRRAAAGGGARPLGRGGTLVTLRPREEAAGARSDVGVLVTGSVSSGGVPVRRNGDS